MSADYQNMIAKLQMALAQQQQQGPSLFGLQAAPDPNNTAAMLGKLQNQEYVNEQGNTGGEYGFLANAGRKDFARAGQSLGNILGVGQPPQQDNSAIMAQRQAIMAGKQQFAQGVAQPGADPNQVQIQTLTALAQQGVPGAAEALEKANDAASKLALAKAQIHKDTAQGDSATDEIANRAIQQKLDQAKLDQATAKDTWTTIGQGNGYIVQKNGLGEIQTKKNQDATSAQQAAVTPQGMQAIMDYYDLHDALPANLPKGVAGNAWTAIGARRAAAGDTEGAAAAQRASLKSNTDALTQTQKQLSATGSYIDTMDKNITKAEELSKQLNFSDVKGLNSAYQSWLSGTSDPKYAQYNLFFSSVGSEFAKIKSGSLGNAPVSDAQMHQAMEDLNKQAGGLAPQALFDAVRAEGQNRLTSLAAERDDLVGRIGGKNGRALPGSVAPQPPAASQAPGSAIAPPAPALNYNPKTGTFE